MGGLQIDSKISVHKHKVVERQDSEINEVFGNCMAEVDVQGI